MRKKLISYDTFNRISASSLSNAENELTNAEDLLADILEANSLSLHCFDTSNVYYETDNGNYIRADYTMDDQAINFKNLEEVVIDDESFKAVRKKTIGNMLEAVLEDDKNRATHLFRNLLEISAPKMKYMKGNKPKSACEKMTSNLKEGEDRNADKEKIWGKNNPDMKRVEAGKKGHREHPEMARKGWEKRKTHKSKIAAEHKSSEWKEAKKKAELFKKTGRKGARVKGHRYGEWAGVGEHVLEYVRVTTNAPSIGKVFVERDDLNNVKSIVLPTSRVRNEGKLLQLKWDTLKTDVKTLRESAMRLGADEGFQKNILDVKRSNNLSDNENLEESLNKLVAAYPSVLYLTQDELARTISEALTMAEASNFDNTICDFLAEGILRVAFESYPDRVAKIASLANANLQAEGDQYEIFQTAVSAFYPTVDENVEIEMRVFEDLAEVFNDMRNEAVSIDSEILYNQANSYLTRCVDILEGRVRPSLSLAEEASAYLVILKEEMETWVPTKHNIYVTTAGEHPEMMKKSSTSYSPKSGGGADSYGGKLPVSDGHSYRNGGEKEMREKSWGNIGGSDVYPSLSNPLQKNVNPWTMPKNKGVNKDGENSLGQMQGQTWPELDNKLARDGGKRHVSDDNRVDN